MKLAAAPNRHSRRRSGFTLLEVLVVVAILVILATVASVAIMRNLDDAKKNQAQLKAASISKACDAYFLNPSSGNQYPTQLQDLVQPPWGGVSFLNDGINDLIDPWGNQFQYNPNHTQPDGSQKPLVFTTSGDSSRVPISQFGVGPASRLQ